MKGFNHEKSYKKGNIVYSEKTAVDFKENDTGNPVIGAVYELHEIDSGDSVSLESQTTDVLKIGTSRSKVY